MGFLAKVRAKVSAAFTPRVLVHHRGQPVGYQAGQQDRFDMDFAPATVGPNLLADQNLDLARRRSRWLVDNDALVAGARETFCANVLPTHIYPEPATEWPEVNEQISALFWEYAEGVDVARSRTLLEDQRLFAAEVFTVGEILPHFPIAPTWRGFAEGPATELIDTDRLDDGLALAGTGEKKIRQGVEFDSLGRPVAYHVLENHPADGAWNVGGRNQTKRITIADAELAFRRRRPGQVRGVPHLHAVMRTQRMIGRYKEAGLAQALAAACIGLYFKGISPATVLGNASGDRMATDAHGNPIEALEPGLVGYLPRDADVEVKGGNLPGPQFDTTVKQFNRDAAKGAGLSYSEYTGDYAEATFSSERAAQLLTRRMVRPEQEFIWNKHTRPFYRRLIAWGIATGRLALPAQARAAWMENPEKLYAATVVWPGFEWVNPQQEAQAAAIELEMGTMSVPEICAARGQHFEDVVDRQLAFELYEKKQREALGLEPRAKAANGQMAKGQSAKEEEEKKPRLVKSG